VTDTNKHVCRARISRFGQCGWGAAHMAVARLRWAYSAAAQARRATHNSVIRPLLATARGPQRSRETGYETYGAPISLIQLPLIRSRRGIAIDAYTGTNWAKSRGADLVCRCRAGPASGTACVCCALGQASRAKELMGQDGRASIPTGFMSKLQAPSRRAAACPRPSSYSSAGFVEIAYAMDRRCERTKMCISPKFQHVPRRA